MIFRLKMGQKMKLFKIAFYLEMIIGGEELREFTWTAEFKITEILLILILNQKTNRGIGEDLLNLFGLDKIFLELNL